MSKVLIDSAHQTSAHQTSPHQTGVRPGMTRRGAMASLLAISAASALAACRDSSSGAPSETAQVSASFAQGAQFFSADEMATIAALAETIIPETDTAGAIGAGVPEKIQDLASDWGDDDYRRYMRGGIASLAGMIRKDAGQDVSAMAPKMRENTLARYDAKVFAANATDLSDDAYTDGMGNDPEPKDPAQLASEKADRDRDGFYKEFKNLVATAYYMSEPGATEELAYEPVPGEWIGDAPLSDYPKTWAT